jgi:c-di-GMP-binding flagellar brake protein YcgR
MQERRRFPRVEYPCKVTIGLEEKKDEFNLHTENVSAGGMRVILPKQFQVNTPAAVQLTIDKRVIRTTGRVAWAIEAKLPGRKTPGIDTGIEFTHLNPDDKEFLSNLIEDILAKAKQ